MKHLHHFILLFNCSNLQIWVPNSSVIFAVEGWTFPKRDIEITLPEDYPLNVPFYRLPVILSKKDVEKNTAIDYTIKIVPSRKSENRATSVQRDNYVKIDKSTGILTLIKRIPSSPIRGRRRHKVFVNITLDGSSRNHKQMRNCSIFIEFSDTMENFCTHYSHLCFPAKKTEYNILEDTVVDSKLDYLMNPGLPTVCPNVSLEYSILSDHDLVSVNNVNGELTLISEPDADVLPSITFNVTCQVENKDFTMDGNIFFIDVNDNGPTSKDGNTTQQLIYYLKPYTRELTFQVNALDKDAKHLNKLKTTIENDTLKLFTAKPLTEYENINEPKGTYYSANIHSEDLLKYNFSEYNFTVIVEDKALKKKGNKVIFEISLIRESYQNIELQDVYEVNISRRASKSSRVLQISTVPLNNHRFSLSNWRRDKDWLNITSKSGIVFIRNPLLMTNKSTEKRKIMWRKKNETHEISGTSILIINIDEGSPVSCGDVMWCNYYGSKEECIENCGRGSAIGLCSWRDESLTFNPTNQYAACSPDFATCPDNECDELEQMDPKICPLDCTRNTVGTSYSLPSNKGIGIAKGSCFCETPSSCRCISAPAEMRIFGGFEILNKTGNEPKNDSGIDTGKRFVDDETSTSIEIIPMTGILTDGSCGTVCVVLASMTPCVILFLIVIVFVVRKFRGNHMSHLKVGGSRISLSAVPSDYVQERPNSVQDSRTTTSETSNASKTVLDPKWEFPRNRLQFQTILGEGEFGKVVKAQASNIDGIRGLTTVAVKMLKENGGPEEMQDLISEFTLLKDISHPNVIKLLGACTEKGGPFYLIVEYAEMGSLRSYLRKRRKRNNCCKYNATYGIQDVNVQPPREYYQFLCERSRYEPRHCFFHKEQLSFAWQIAKGMAYLSDMKLVHRDLAARNILLDKKKVAKISDFGLSRDVYKGEAYLKKTKGRVPVKWLAIESLEDQIYTSRSDVWSFGIVMWEIMMQGATPYPGVTPQRLFNLLKAGYRMSKPEYCPDELYVIMKLCWRKSPHERPSFKELVQKLENLLQDTVDYVDLGAKNALTNPKVLDRPLLSFGDPTSSSIQYTSVLIDNEEEFSDEESFENIGLVNLFNEVEREGSKASSDKESTA